MRDVLKGASTASENVFFSQYYLIRGFIRKDPTVQINCTLLKYALLKKVCITKESMSSISSIKIYLK